MPYGYGMQGEGRGGRPSDGTGSAPGGTGASSVGTCTGPAPGDTGAALSPAPYAALVPCAKCASGWRTRGGPGNPSARDLVRAELP